MSSTDAIAWLKANWSRYWEFGVLALIVLAGAGLRLWDLGARSLNHDESLHATYSWYLYTGGKYVHDPMMHGPFQFFTATPSPGRLLPFSVARLFSATSRTGARATTRRGCLPPSSGRRLIALPYLLPQLHRARRARLFAALFLAFSPVIALLQPLRPRRHLHRRLDAGPRRSACGAI